jgi:hypothetical protein
MWVIATFHEYSLAGTRLDDAYQYAIIPSFQHIRFSVFKCQYPGVVRNDISTSADSVYVMRGFSADVSFLMKVTKYYDIFFMMTSGVMQIDVIILY